MTDYISIQFNFLTFAWLIFPMFSIFSNCAKKPKDKEKKDGLVTPHDPVMALSPMNPIKSPMEKPNDDFPVGTPLPNIPLADLPDHGDNTLHDIESIQSEKTMIKTKQSKTKAENGANKKSIQQSLKKQ